MCYRDKVQALTYSGASKQLISTADDKILGIWDMQATRIEVSPHISTLYGGSVC